MKKNRMAVWVGLALVTMGAAQVANAGGRPDLVIKGLKAGQPHVSGELLVKYRDGAVPADRDAVVQGLGAQKLETVRRGNGRNGEIALLKLPGNMDLSAAVQVLSADPAVEYAEPNWTYRHNAVSNDTYSTNGSLWGMYGDAGTPANVYGSQASEAWAAGHTSCGNVVVGVIDEGIYFTHEDLTANIWTNPYDPSTASTTTAMATWTTCADGTSTATATTSTPAGPPTTTARTWPAPSPAWAATARAWPVCAGAV